MRTEPPNRLLETDDRSTTEPVELLPNRVTDDKDPMENPRVRQAAVLFVDIVDFTATVEDMEPERMLALLRSFHRRMSGTVLAHHGTIDNCLGDAVLATFGTSLPNIHDATNALLCAREMLRELERWNGKRAARGAAKIEVGIGIHYGDVVVGNIGDERRPEFAVIGDVVNVASRIERLTRQYNAQMIVSGDLVDAVRREGNRASDLLEAFMEVEFLDIRGRRNPIAIRVYKDRRRGSEVAAVL